MALSTTLTLQDSGSVWPLQQQDISVSGLTSLASQTDSDGKNRSKETLGNRSAFDAGRNEAVL